MSETTQAQDLAYLCPKCGSEHVFFIYEEHWSLNGPSKDDGGNPDTIFEWDDVTSRVYCDECSWVGYAEGLTRVVTTASITKEVLPGRKDGSSAWRDGGEA